MRSVTRGAESAPQRHQRGRLGISASSGDSAPSRTLRSASPGALRWRRTQKKRGGVTAVRCRCAKEHQAPRDLRVLVDQAGRACTMVAVCDLQPVAAVMDEQNRSERCATGYFLELLGHLAALFRL